ncbi:relaxase/mobilization nuclease domain-containing protein [Klebsiella michiganensis]|uniref:relaxase/mobilization nuclease domain-containing protein n=1 Tax=Klebsiella michiganensis TaxID=1134687 RepID=UPI00388D3F0D
MIVKFHPRGRGGGAGPVDYLLGKDRQREGASVLQGKPEEVRELIDASPYVKKYTSGVLSFAEADLPPGQREKLMASFERVLMPGLDKDQYSILWVEHEDKGRLELNFLIPNTELLTGRRLQPYYDRADRPRIDAWQTIVNGRDWGCTIRTRRKTAGRWSRRPDCRKRSRKPQKPSPVDC